MSAVSWHGEPYIRAAVLYGFADLIRSRGGDAAALVSRVGIDPAALTDPDLLISYSRHGMLMELAAAELDIPDFGLELAMSIPSHFPNAGPVIFLARMADDLGGWLEQALRYWRHHTNAHVFERLEDEEAGTVTLRFRREPPAVPPRQQSEFKLACCCHMMRVVTGQPGLSPLRVHLHHDRPASTRAHELAFGCDMEFAAEHNAFVFEARQLAQPASGRLMPPKAMFDSFMRYRIRHMPLYNQSIRTTTEIAIRTVLGSGLCSKEFVAESMGITPGQLRRLLANSGTTFSELLDGTRKALACQMLTHTGVPISAVAGLLDYSSTTALALAMKRWTGTTPSGYRARGRAAAAEPRPAGTDEAIVA